MRKRINRWISNILAASLLFTSMEMPSFAAGETADDGNEIHYESSISEDENEEISEQSEYDVNEDGLFDEPDMSEVDDPHFSLSEDATIEDNNNLVYAVGDTVSSGKCGAQLNWSLKSISENDYALYINGIGEMDNYDEYNVLAPWSQYGSKIKEITISEGVTNIGEDAFISCRNLPEIVLPKGIKSIERGAFYSCANLVKASLPQGLTSIGQSAFSNCYSLTEIIIPDGVESVGKYAFWRCYELEKVQIPTSLTKFNYDGVFVDCKKLKTAGVVGGNYNIEFDWEEAIPDYAFINCDCLEEITVPEGITSIGSYSFAECDGIVNCDLPDGLKTIGGGAFYCCSSLNEISIPEGVSNFGSGLFENCSNLEKIVIPESMRDFKSYSAIFRGCEKLKTAGPVGGGYNIEFAWSEVIPAYALYGSDYLNSIYVPESIVRIEEYAFAKCTCLKTVHLPGGLTSISNGLFSGCSALKDLIIPSGVESIGSQSFSGCSSIINIDIPAGVKSLGWAAFKDCSALKNIVIPDGINRISQEVFSGCKSLELIVIPSSVRVIEKDAFKNCIKIKEFTFTHLWYIEEGAFYGCESVESFTVPAGVSTIKKETFCACKNLKSIYMYGAIKEIEDYAFDQCSSLTDVYYDSKESMWNTISIGVYNSALKNATKHFGDNYGSGKLEDNIDWVIDGDGVLTISGSGPMSFEYFYECPWKDQKEHVIKIYIEDGITTISGEYFRNSTNLITIYIPVSVEKIDPIEFTGCTSLKEAEYSGTKAQWDNLVKNVSVLKDVKVKCKAVVIFDANGGTVTPTSKSIVKGEAYGDLPVPDEREGYTFLGWFTEKEGGTEVKSTTKVTNGETHTIYAHWKAAQVKVSFDANGGTVATSYKTVDFGSEYGQLPVPMWDGYTFDGWYTEKTGGEKITEESIVDTVENHTLYAHWKGKSVKVTFDDNYGKVVSVNIVYGDTYGDLPVPKAREHMQFLGWFTEKEGGTQITEDTVMESQEPVTLYAHWKGETYTVTFDANEGKTVNTSIKVEFGQKYGELPKTSREEYIFGGWYTEKEEGERIDESSIVTIAEDHTLYAHWGNTPVESVTLDKKTLQMLIGEEAQLTATVSPADATNLKVIWSSTDETVASVSDGKVSANKAGKAVITATTEDGGYTDTCEVTVSTAYKLTFMVDDAVYATIFVKEGQVAEKVDPPVSDRKFVGWYYNDQLWNPSSPVYSDMVLVAHFKDEAEEESGSALDSQPDLNADSIILVKGQKFVVEGDGWISSDKSVLTVNKKGNVTAKKPTSAVGLLRIVGGKTVKSIKVTIKQPNIEPGFTLYVGKDKKVSLTGITGLDVIWNSSATDVAVVDGEGVVQAISKGTATISAIINGVEFKCKVTVKDADTSKKNFSNTVELVPMQSTNVKVNGFKASKAIWDSDLEAVPASKLGKGVVYENAVVRITKSGKLTAIGVGETELTATGGGIGFKVKIVVSAPVTQIVHLNVNSSKTIKIYGTKGALAWRGDVNGLQITKNKIKALSSGMRTITAQYENFEYKVIIYAEDPSIVTKEISGAYPKYTLQMKVGETVAITEKETYQNILYRSNKNNIAFVDEAGVITARSSGKATITAKVNGKKITIVVNVTG